jgi:hypothetical protein
MCIAAGAVLANDEESTPPALRNEWC